jgi:hypothetical protein
MHPRMNVHMKVLMIPVPEKFNTFNTFNTFTTFDHVASGSLLPAPRGEGLGMRG